MSKLVLICPRHRASTSHSAKDIETLSKRLCPKIITPNPPSVSEPHGVLMGVLNPTTELPAHSGSLCLGMLLDPRDDWWRPGADVPDGSYALFRIDADSVELVTDIVASRNIWYVQTDDMFIASSSQRAIVSLLGDFEPSRAPFPWMFSSGTLGPGFSWDRRIRQLPADGRALLERRSWKLTETREPVVFEPAARSEEGHRQALKDAMDETFEHFDIDCDRWILPLSGGADSRAILLFMMKNGLRPRCVTWGIQASMGRKDNDATIARAVAEHFGLEHRYLTTDISSDEPLETILDLFIRTSEGGTDLLEPYMDGFKLWKGLYEEGTAGQIRGDELFGHRGVATPLDMRAQCWCPVLADYPNLVPLISLGLEGQEMPEGESLSTWKDRTFQTYTEPGVLAAMNEIMCHYIEIVNPLVARRIVHETRTIPDEYRDDKRAYRKLILSVGPQMGWAKHIALAKTLDLMTTRPMVDEFRDKLDTRHARDLLSGELIDLILGRMVVAEGVAPPSQLSAARLLARRLIPKMLRKWLRSAVWRPPLAWNIVALRAYLICKMNRILQEDAKLFH